MHPVGCFRPVDTYTSPIRTQADGPLRIYSAQLNELEQRRREGNDKPCFASELLDSGAKAEFTRDQLLYILGTLMEAGSDTTRMTMNQVIAGAALFPDWVERARKELDAVCGPSAERLPYFGDLDSLPLIKAAVKESLRWKYVTTQISWNVFLFAFSQTR